MVARQYTWTSFTLLATIYLTVVHAIARAWAAWLDLCKRVYIITIQTFRAHHQPEPTLPLTTRPSQINSTMPSTSQSPDAGPPSTAVSASTRTSATSIHSIHSTRSHPPQASSSLDADVLTEVGSIFSSHTFDDELPDEPLP
ncbi:hypothetical protein B0A52_03984 [Exophiala mesophila]|uniref:Uncharacterized protein n=1 Tax=Exophiala mesophila TaxID=212818 RepID=A0A438N9Z9_EXOME|nr:hypothetical protein B0A52_03984 [Exophiala mesophila]